MKLLILDSKTMVKNAKESKFTKFIDNALVVVASDGLQVSGDNPNTTHIPQLVPPAAITQRHISGDVTGFNRLYVKFLQSPQITVILSSLLSNAAKEDKNIVFLCNTIEDGFAYLDLLGNYLQAAYGIEPVTVKKVVKGKDKEYDVDPEDIIAKCEERFARAESISPNVMDDVKSMFDEGKKKKGKKKKKKK